MIQRVEYQLSSAQIMHIGQFSAEGPTIEKIHAFIKKKGCEFTGKHHEIYLSDPRKSAPEKMKTILRQPMKLLILDSLIRENCIKI